MSIASSGNSGPALPRLGMALRGPWPRSRSTAKADGDQGSAPPLVPTSDAPVEPELAEASPAPVAPLPESQDRAGELSTPAHPPPDDDPPAEEPDPGSQAGSDPAGNQTVTMAAKTKAMAQELILSGALDNLLGNILAFLKKIETFITHAENGTGIINRIVTLVKEELQREMAQSPGAAGRPGDIAESTSGLGGLGGLPISSLQLAWNLMQTNEFQQLMAKMIAQALKPPPEPKPPGVSNG